MENFWDFCQADADFYELPYEDTGMPFPAAEKAAPVGWLKRRDGGWTHLLPSASMPPEQGWKVHVSVTAEHATATIDTIYEYCIEHGIAFKFLTSSRMHLLQNAKYAPRGGSGKFVTIYPADDSHLHAVLTELGDQLAGLEGPYILGDLRWREGPLYVRFGGYHKLLLQDGIGREVLAVRAPDGRLVPDIRGPIFAPPSWAPMPEFLLEAVASSAANSGEGLPYEVSKALHFSNGGGIYLAKDPSSGEQVVLREARPYAGLDGTGQDAVSRLYQEAETLRALADMEFVPHLFGTFQAWEHHYLVEEYIQGETLWDWMVAHNPVLGGESLGTAEYTATALGMLDQLEQMISRLNERGFVFADLHPRNVMVRPDGRLALVDFETAYRLETDREPTMGCPGFVSDHARSGRARDLYALSCLRVAMFLPLTALLDDARVDPADLVEAVTEVFPVPATLTHAAREGLRRPGVTRKKSRLRERFDIEEPGALRTLIGAVADSISGTATSERTDRLFPGDPQGLSDGGYNLAYGAAGVLAALHYAGRPIAAEHVDWLTAATRRHHARAGLYDGLAGAAVVLDTLGRHHDAAEAMDRAFSATTERAGHDLFSGLAGVGVALRHFACTTAESHWQDRLDVISHRLADVLPSTATGSSSDKRSPAGLLHGWGGAAVYFLRRYTDTNDSAYLDAARRAIDADLAHCAFSESGAMMVKRGSTALPFLGVGSAGLAAPIAEYLEHRTDERLAAAYDGILAACETTFTMESGLFGGRAGLLVSMAAAGRAAALRSHVHRLGWHAVDRADGVAFPGRWLLRLSMDLGTGSAGVLLALRATEIARSGFVSSDAERRRSRRSWAHGLGLPLPMTPDDAGHPILPGHKVRLVHQREEL